MERGTALRLTKLFKCSVILGAWFTCALAFFAYEAYAQQPPASPPPSQTATPKAPPEIHSAGPLEIHKRVERSLAGGQSDMFTVDVPAGQFVHIALNKQGIDVTLLVADPSGETVGFGYRPNGGVGPVPASVIAATSGTYSLKVAPYGDSVSEGKYSIEVTDIRPLTQQDVLRVQAETQFVHGMALANLEESTACSESRRKLFNLT